MVFSIQSNIKEYEDNKYFLGKGKMLPFFYNCKKCLN